MKGSFPIRLLPLAFILNMDSERIPRSLLRGLASELPKIIGYLAGKIPCTLVQGASILAPGFRI